MSLPSPKELIKPLAEAHDAMVELATKPIRDIASSLGLPEPPEPPKASEIVDALPEPPTPSEIAEALPLPLPKLEQLQVRTRTARGKSIGEAREVQLEKKTVGAVEAFSPVIVG